MVIYSSIYNEVMSCNPRCNPFRLLESAKRDEYKLPAHPFRSDSLALAVPSFLFWTRDEWFYQVMHPLTLDAIPRNVISFSERFLFYEIYIYKIWNNIKKFWKLKLPRSKIVS